MTIGFRLARAVYNAAVSPAGPEPMMTTLRDMLVEHLLERVLVGQSDHLLDQLTALEQQERRDPADAEAHRCRRVLVHVHLRHDEAAIVVVRELVHRRREAAAGA